MPTPEKVTTEQAAAALQQLMPEEEGSAPVEMPREELPSETVPPAAPTEEAPGEAVPEGQEAATETEEVDDVASLKKRLETIQAEKEAREKEFVLRQQAFQKRQAESERILRDRYLKKATVADKALKFMRAAKTEQGVPPDQWDRVIEEIESTMNPASSSFTPPAVVEGTEEQAIILNSFLNEKGMTAEEADQFGGWIQTEGARALTPAEQAVAHQSLDGFLRIAHGRYREGVQQKERETQRANTIEAVKSVQRTQKEAARAASAAPAAPRKQPAGQKAGVDVKKLNKRDVSELLQAAVRQYE